jgi:hypothetical protein
LIHGVSKSHVAASQPMSSKGFDEVVIASILLRLKELNEFFHHEEHKVSQRKTLVFLCDTLW